MVTVPSASKLNVFLEVCGRRDDGFHELETVMVRTSLADVMTFAPAEGAEISLRHADEFSVRQAPRMPLDATNLIVRAARALQSLTGVQQGARITVAKRIPPESGLAGGSGNAATTLRVLNRLWNLNLSESELHAVAAALGSDINFLLSGARAAVCRGRGELITPVPLPCPLHFVAVRPVQGNSTAAVFAAVDTTEQRRPLNDVVTAIAAGRLDWLEACCFNRLTKAAASLNGSMVRVTEQLLAMWNRPVFMSGSGSTVFVMARSRREAQRIVSGTAMALRLPTWALFV